MAGCSFFMSARWKYQSKIKAPASLARLQLLSVRIVRLRHLNTHRLGFIFDLKLE